MKPEAGQWWFANDGSGPVFIVGRRDDGNVVYQERRLGPMLVSLDGWDNWHHEPRCTGWDWVVPESEKWPKYYETFSPDLFAFVERVSESQWRCVRLDGTKEPLGGCLVTPDRKEITEVQAMALLNKPEQCISHDEHRGEWRCKNPALPGKDHCGECADDEAQPQKTRVRLWKFCGSETVVASTIEKTGDWQEIHHDSEGFYVEG